MPIDLPHSLAKGVRLDDERVLLPWNATRDALARIASPRTEPRAGGRLALWWTDRRWLGSLQVTLVASLAPAEPFRRIEVLANPGRPAEAEFDRFANHLSLQLGAPTRALDSAAGSRTRYWNRGDVEASLRTRGRGEAPTFEVCYRGLAPKCEAAAQAGGGGQTFEQLLERLGLTDAQWRALRNYLFDLQAGVAAEPPAELRGHEVVRLALESRDRADRALLDRAAARLSGAGAQAWLALEKS